MCIVFGFCGGCNSVDLLYSQANEKVKCARLHDEVLVLDSSVCYPAPKYPPTSSKYLNSRRGLAEFSTLRGSGGYKFY